MLGRTYWNSISFVLLFPLVLLACHERKAPELSVRTPHQSQPNPEEKGHADQDKSSPVSTPSPGSASSPSVPSSSSDETMKSVITIGDLASINVPWTVALVSIQDAKTGTIKYAETIANPSPPQRFQVPYGFYIITLEFFADAAKSQSLAKSCPADQTRIHKVNEETYSAILNVCAEGKSEPVMPASDVVIRPVIIP